MLNLGMFTQRLKISVVFTLKFHANCIHKTSFKSFATSKNFHYTVPFPSLPQSYCASSCSCYILELKGHIWTWCEKTFLSGNLLCLGEGTLNQLVVLLHGFFEAASFARMRGRLSSCYLLETNASWAVLEYPHIKL